MMSIAELKGVSMVRLMSWLSIDSASVVFGARGDGAPLTGEEMLYVAKDGVAFSPRLREFRSLGIARFHDPRPDDGADDSADEDAGDIADEDPDDIAEDAAEILHSGKAGARGDMGDFDLCRLQQLHGIFQTAGVQSLAKRLARGHLNAG